MGRSRVCFCRAAVLLVIALVWVGVIPAAGQGTPGFPPGSPSTSSTVPFMGASASQPPGSPYGSDTVSLHSGMFRDLMPVIPNLEFGYTLSFGPEVRQGRAWGDYVLPIRLGTSHVAFGEVHGEYVTRGNRQALTPPQTPGFTTNVFASEDRIDLSFGGGYRTIINDSVMLGGNAFYDSSRLFGTWYASGGFGLETCAIMFTGAAFDLNFNWYGNLFTRGSFINAWRNQRGSFDVEAGYSQGVFENTLDLRLKTVGYSFDAGDRVWGWKVGGDLTTRDGMFAIKYEYGRDKLNDSYHSLTAQVNVGFQLENLLSGQSPISKPSPVFVNPRNLGRLLGLKVKRNWHQPSAVLAFNRVAKPTSQGGGRCSSFACDRTVAPFPLTFVGGTTYSALHTFTQFPVGSLTPDGIVCVRVTLANPAPAGLTISVAVIGADLFSSNQGDIVASGGETDLTIPLTYVAPQSLFVGNPYYLVITVYNGAFTANGITSACIGFNH